MREETNSNQIEWHLTAAWKRLEYYFEIHRHRLVK